MYKKKYARDLCSPMRFIAAVSITLAFINLFFLYVYLQPEDTSYSDPTPTDPTNQNVKIPPYTRPPYTGPPNFPEKRLWKAANKNIPDLPRYSSKLKGNYFQNAVAQDGFYNKWSLTDTEYDCTKGECAQDKFPECSWNGGPYLYKPLKNPTPYQKMIKFLNWSNITYFLITGSALGAVRNGGVIPGDGDIDVVFPVWLQSNDFDDLCPDAHEKSGPILRSPTPQKEESLTLCGKTRKDWVTKATEYIRELGAYPSFKVGVSPRKFGGFRLLGGAGVDFVVSIYDQALVNGTREGTGGICRCEFSGVEALALEDSWLSTERIYGENWIYPRKEPAQHVRKKGK